MRVVHCKREPYDVYIGRPGPYGNPYSHTVDSLVDVRNLVTTREEAIALFERDLRGWLEIDRTWTIETYLSPLVGKVLGCWCFPKACHGDVIIKVCREVGLIP